MHLLHKDFTVLFRQNIRRPRENNAAWFFSLYGPKMLAYTRLLHVETNSECVLLSKYDFHDIPSDVFSQCMTSNVC